MMAKMCEDILKPCIRGMVSIHRVGKIRDVVEATFIAERNPSKV